MHQNSRRAAAADSRDASNFILRGSANIRRHMLNKSRQLTRRRFLNGSLRFGIGIVGAGLIANKRARASTLSSTQAVPSRMAPMAALAGASGTQCEWARCKKCRGLFYGPQQSLSSCPSGERHDGSSSANYQLLYQDPAVPQPEFQPNWRWCSKCRGLAFAGNGTSGVCPAGSAHNLSASFNYHLYHDDLAIDGEETDWHWCRKCQGLFYGPQRSVSHCQAGSTHDDRVTFNYILDTLLLCS